MDKTNQQNTNNPSNKPANQGGSNQDPSKGTVKDPVTPAPEKGAPTSPPISK